MCPVGMLFPLVMGMHLVLSWILFMFGIYGCIFIVTISCFFLFFCCCFPFYLWWSAGLDTLFLCVCQLFAYSIFIFLLAVFLYFATIFIFVIRYYIYCVSVCMEVLLHGQSYAIYLYIRHTLWSGIYQRSEVDIVNRSTANVCHSNGSFLHCSDVQTGGEDLIR